MYRIIWNVHGRVRFCLQIHFAELGFSRLSVFLCSFFQFLGNHCPNLLRAFEGLLQAVNIRPQLLHFLCPAEDILPIQMPQLDFCHIFRLNFIHRKALHEVRNNFGFFLCFPNNTDCLVNIQQNPL